MGFQSCNFESLHQIIPHRSMASIYILLHPSHSVPCLLHAHSSRFGLLHPTARRSVGSHGTYKMPATSGFRGAPSRKHCASRRSLHPVSSPSGSVEVESADAQETKSCRRLLRRHIVSSFLTCLGNCVLIPNSALIVTAISMYYRIQILSGVDTNWNSTPVIATTSVSFQSYTGKFTNGTQDCGRIHYHYMQLHSCCVLVLDKLLHQIRPLFQLSKWPLLISSDRNGRLVGDLGQEFKYAAQGFQIPSVVFI